MRPYEDEMDGRQQLLNMNRVEPTYDGKGRILARDPLRFSIRSLSLVWDLKSVTFAIEPLPFLRTLGILHDMMLLLDCFT